MRYRSLAHRPMEEHREIEIERDERKLERLNKTGKAMTAAMIPEIVLLLFGRYR